LNLIERWLLEQYQRDAAGAAPRVTLKPAQEIRADSLQSPHDEDAAYREKKDETVRGYSANVTETCAEELNLIVDVRVEPATAADNAYLQDAVQNSESVVGRPAQEIYPPGRYRFRTAGKRRYITDKDIDAAPCRRRQIFGPSRCLLPWFTEKIRRSLFAGLRVVDRRPLTALRRRNRFSEGTQGWGGVI